MDAIFHRRSVRKFKEKPIEHEKIVKILKAGMHAPTACNQQNWEFYLVVNREIKEQLAKCSPYAGPVENAPMAIVVTYKDEAIAPELNHVDCAIAVENMWLEANHLDLGAVMLAVAPFEDRMKIADELLKLKDNEHTFAILPLGYPDEEIKEQEDRYDESKIHFR